MLPGRLLIPLPGVPRASCRTRYQTLPGFLPGCEIYIPSFAHFRTYADFKGLIYTFKRDPRSVLHVPATMVYIGYDIGSSSVKAALIDGADGREILRVQSPEGEMPINAPEPGWGEQDPGMWWEHSLNATRSLLEQSGTSPEEVQGIGISYQMHGLVTVDKALHVIRPSIIWSDSRAVESGEQLAELAGEEACREQLMNRPGNFTLAKLFWLKQHEPETYGRIHKIMLPGDYIAMRFCGYPTTTASGLSEGILWDFKADAPANWLLEKAGIDPELLPEIVPGMGMQGQISARGAAESGLPEGTPILYRAGDQPNNALALNVMEPGQVAATGGTSGVVYAVTDRRETGEMSRINNFAHVNHRAGMPRIGKLLCINGTGIQYSWLKKQLGETYSYAEMNRLAATVPPGSEGLRVYPFGNGAERMLENRHMGAQISGIDFNIHNPEHLCRAVLEGIAYAFVYGMEIMEEDGVSPGGIRAGNDNLFRARPFGETIATLTGATIDLITTTGAAGAGRAAALSEGRFTSMAEATATDQIEGTYAPLPRPEPYRQAYQDWKNKLDTLLKNVHP